MTDQTPLETQAIVIRPDGPADDDAIWRILAPVIREGETYPLHLDTDREGAFAYWRAPGHTCFVAEVDGEVLGIYHLRTNQGGPGNHVANCGYMVAPAARGRGIASALCQHSLEEARRRGYRAVQFNLVVATNTRAIALWKRHGFTEIGRLPGAFRHPPQGYVDALVMYQTL